MLNLREISEFEEKCSFCYCDIPLSNNEQRSGQPPSFGHLPKAALEKEVYQYICEPKNFESLLYILEKSCNHLVLFVIIENLSKILFGEIGYNYYNLGRVLPSLDAPYSSSKSQHRRLFGMLLGFLRRELGGQSLQCVLLDSACNLLSVLLLEL